MNSHEIKICGEDLQLLPERAIYWERKQTLIVSDLHLGKAGHFRKHGIPVSRNVHITDLMILEKILKSRLPAEVILLGDLFHSFKNNEWDDFLQFVRVYDMVKFILVRGNHDIMEEYPPELEVVDMLERDPFTFTHQKEDTELYNLSGHIHPGFRIRGLAREGLTVPCFYFSGDSGILPAFGQFTGIKRIRPKDGDRVFGVADDNVIELI